MITERDLAEKFSVVWKQHFPLLRSNFMRVFNEGQVETINTNAIPIGNNIRFDLVSEAAFNVSKTLYEQNISWDSFSLQSNALMKSIELTAKSIWGPEFKEEELLLTIEELDETKKISANILEFISLEASDNVQFKPYLKGYGILPDMIADISIGNTLYEVKTVNRNYKSSDLKQVLIYLALKQVTSDSNWEFAGLYNPRKGTFCKFNIKSLVFNLSGGNTTNETFENFLNSLSRDVLLDAKF